MIYSQYIYNLIYIFKNTILEILWKSSYNFYQSQIISKTIKDDNKNLLVIYN